MDRHLQALLAVGRVVRLHIWSGSLCVALLIHAEAAHAQAQSKIPAKSDMLSFTVVPPMVTGITLKPKSASSATLTLQLQSDPRLKSKLTFEAGDKQVELKLDKSGTPTYAGTIPIDFGTLEEEQGARQQANNAGVTVPVFDVREFVKSEPIPFIDPRLIAKSVAAHVAFQIIPNTIIGSQMVVDPSHELLITDPSVIADPTRTYDPCTNTGTPGGAWTFGTLMTAMANQSSTGVTPQDFVQNLLNSWTVTQVVNGWHVGPRPIGAANNLLGFWPRTGGFLDVLHAPLRLMAIVNRIDLRLNGSYGSVSSAGEGRFVFQVVQPPSATNNSCQVQPFTIILEYGVPITGCTHLHNWAAQWHALGGTAFGASYNTALQAITDVFALADADSSKENGSAINQIRTDEIQLASPWQLRQFELAKSGNGGNGLPADNNLHQTTVSQTPDNSLDFTSVITSYLTQSVVPSIAPLQYPGTAPFLGGASDNLLQFWDGNPSVPTDGRNKFSLNTCNGCHGGESQTSFLHMFLTLPNTVTVSNFLTGGSPNTLAAPGTYTINDPVSGVTRTYGDLLRRKTDLEGLLGSSCNGGGIISGSTFLPILSAD